MKNDFKHLLALESLSKEQILIYLDRAHQFYQQNKTHVESTRQLLKGKTVVNLFFENSTRTRISFEIAAKNLGANVINFNTDTSSTKKGESFLDTIDTLAAMGTDSLIIRHPCSGTAEFVARHIKTHLSVINAGDGCHEHPSQGLLDLFTIRQHKQHFHQLKVVIVGDILHSRVARSLIHGLNTVGNPEIWVCGPKTLVPTAIEKLGVNISYRLPECIKEADVVVSLRLQHERMQHVYIPNENEYRLLYGIDNTKLALAKPDVIVMHPGPMNRDVEISSEVADGSHCVALEQVNYGVWVRMAIMQLLLNQEAQL